MVYGTLYSASLVKDDQWSSLYRNTAQVQQPITLEKYSVKFCSCAAMKETSVTVYILLPVCLNTNIVTWFYLR